MDVHKPRGAYVAIPAWVRVYAFGVCHSVVLRACSGNGAPRNAFATPPSLAYTRARRQNEDAHPERRAIQKVCMHACICVCLMFQQAAQLADQASELTATERSLYWRPSATSHNGNVILCRQHNDVYIHYIMPGGDVPSSLALRVDVFFTRTCARRSRAVIMCQANMKPRAVVLYSRAGIIRGRVQCTQVYVWLVYGRMGCVFPVNGSRFVLSLVRAHACVVSHNSRCKINKLNYFLHFFQWGITIISVCCDAFFSFFFPRVCLCLVSRGVGRVREENMDMRKYVSITEVMLLPMRLLSVDELREL